MVAGWRIGFGKVRKVLVKQHKVFVIFIKTNEGQSCLTRAWATDWEIRNNINKTWRLKVVVFF
jgi:hypothetical protein